MKSLHWLPIRQRISFKLLLLVYKCLHNQGPIYLTNCLSVYVPNRQLRSSNDYLRLVYPITRVLAGDRTFTVAASKEWNKLPVYIRQSSSTNIFKKALKGVLHPWPILWLFMCFLKNYSTLVTGKICFLKVTVQGT